MLRPKLLTTLQDYSWSLFRTDLGAGISVAMVAIPLSIAIAIASGATPAQGLVTAVVAGFLISALGGSRVQIGGPTGAFIVVVYGVIAEHGYDGLVTATLMAGAILCVGALLGAGRLIRLVPEPVIDGFTIGIAIIIGTSQLSEALGLVTGPLPADLIHKLPALWEARDTAHTAAPLVTVSTIALIVLFRRLAPALPGLVVAVAITSTLSGALAPEVETVAHRFGALPSGLPLPALPDLSPERLAELLPSALIIAFLAGIESLLSAMVADRMIGGAYRPNAELMAQGAANLGSAMMGGLPATGAIARTATNIRAGGKTPVAGLVHAATILCALLFASGVAGRMALPALAGLLMLTAWNMSEPHRWAHRLTMRRSDQVLMWLTLLLTVLADLTVAIGTGVALGLALRLARRDAPTDWTPPDR